MHSVTHSECECWLKKMTLLKTWSKCTCQRICKHLRLLQFSACCYAFTFFLLFFNYLLTFNLCGQKIRPRICKHLGLLQVRGAKCTFFFFFLTMQALLFPLLSLFFCSLLSSSVLFFVFFCSLFCLLLFSFVFFCSLFCLLLLSFLSSSVLLSSSVVHQDFFMGSLLFLWFIRNSSSVFSPERPSSLVLSFVTAL